MTIWMSARRIVRPGSMVFAVCLIGLGLDFESVAAGGDSKGSARGTNESLVIAHDGKTDFVIVAAKNPTEAEMTAVDELAEYLHKATGAVFPVVEEGKAPVKSRKMYVGRTDFASQHDADGSKLDDEEWIIRTVGRDLVITGGRPRGTLYGVYEFLERELGCHWLDESTEVVAKIPNLVLGELNRRGQPAFQSRSISAGYQLIDKGLFDKEQAYCARNKVNRRSSAPLPAKYGFSTEFGSGGGSHTFANYAKDFPADHPEYLSMNSKGERIGATTGLGPGGICLTHPEVRRLVLARLEKFIVEDRLAAAKGNYPPPIIYDISQNDNHWMCQCPECKALSKREDSESGPVVDFINDIADGIRAKYPDVLVQTFAYSTTVKPPKTLRPRDNVIIRLAELNAEWGRDADLFHPVTHPTNKAQYENLQGWSRIAKYIAEWDYWIQFWPRDKFATPYAPTACIAPDLEAFYRHNVRYIYVECEAPEETSFFALKRWLGFQLMQNPLQPVEPLLATFMSGYYGPAAAMMREYLRLMDVSIAAVDANMSAMNCQDRPYLTLPFYIECERLLDKAEALCASDRKSLLHVRRERIPVDAGLFHMWSDLTINPPAGEKLPLDREMLMNRYGRNRLEQMEAFRTAPGLEKGKRRINGDVSKMLGVVAFEQRKGQPRPPKVDVSQASDIVANGDPTKLNWGKASKLASWLSLGDRAANQNLNVKLLHDERYLYLRLHHACDGAKLKASEMACSGNRWVLFFSTHIKPPCRQLVVDADGKVEANEWPYLFMTYDCRSKLEGKTWPADARVVSQPQADGWTVFVSIPLENIVTRGVKKGSGFYASICRCTPHPGRPDEAGSGISVSLTRLTPIILK